MAEFFEMPQASPTMTEGVLVSWKIAEGDTIHSQDVVAEVETDKAVADVECFDERVLIKILVPAGESVPTGMPIAILGESMDEDITALLAEYEALKKAGPPADAAVKQEKPAAAPEVVRPTAHKLEAPVAKPAPTLKTGLTEATWMGEELIEGIMEVPDFHVAGAPEGQVRASPLARKIAKNRGIDLHNLTGSGPHGRITKADLSQPNAKGPVARPPRQDTRVSLGNMRKTIASRLKESYLDSPAFFLTAQFDCNHYVAFRNRLKAKFPEAKVSYNDLLIACVAQALADVPEVNASWGGDHILQHGNVDIGIAVALDGGLITPVLRNADRVGVRQVATSVKDLVGRARNRKLGPEEYTNSTFTISNLGMMQIEAFTAIINPPNAAILAVGALQEEPCVVAGHLTTGWRMRVTLTCDHRVIDGALGARFLQSLRSYIEAPGMLAI
jgi:pyruvate dehydrogenase E2 component (dihydrolipoamide acetyltransferase)